MKREEAYQVSIKNVSKVILKKKQEIDEQVANCIEQIKKSAEEGWFSAVSLGVTHNEVWEIITNLGYAVQDIDHMFPTNNKIIIWGDNAKEHSKFEK